MLIFIIFKHKQYLLTNKSLEIPKTKYLLYEIDLWILHIRV